MTYDSPIDHEHETQHAAPCADCGNWTNFDNIDTPPSCGDCGGRLKGCNCP